MELLRAFVIYTLEHEELICRVFDTFNIRTRRVIAEFPASRPASISPSTAETGSEVGLTPMTPDADVYSTHSTYVREFQDERRSALDTEQLIGREERTRLDWPVKTGGSFRPD